MVKFGDLTMLLSTFNRKYQVNMSIVTKVFYALLCLRIFGSNNQVRAADNNTTNKSKQVDKLFNCTIQANVPGASVVVIQNGKILHNIIT
jgi:hypothetical protein